MTCLRCGRNALSIDYPTEQWWCERCKVYSNRRLREAYLYQEDREGLSFADVAIRCDWITQDSRTGKDKPDSSRVARLLGLVNDNGKRRQYIAARYALTLCGALHIPPVEVGL